MSDKFDPMPSSRRPPKQTPTTIGNHKLSAATLMMGYGYDPALSEGSLKAPIFLTSTFVFETAAHGAPGLVDGFIRKGGHGRSSHQKSCIASRKIHRARDFAERRHAGDFHRLVGGRVP